MLPPFAYRPISDFSYELPDGRIARQPLPDRLASKLLVWDSGATQDLHFGDLPAQLPEGTQLWLNETKVIPARLLIPYGEGLPIEILLMDPLRPSVDPAVALGTTGDATWAAMVGRAKKWKDGESLALNVRGIDLWFEKGERLETGFEVTMRWLPADLTLAEVLDTLGHVPLPPYLGREDAPEDKGRYQTVYAATPGSVAAPTAGLHLTPELLRQLKSKRVDLQKLTLHVGAGTFQPVKGDKIADHPMHAERFTISRKGIEALLADREGPLVPVGTTSLRALESVVWLGRKAAWSEPITHLGQWEAYREELRDIPVEEALETLLDLLKGDSLTATTALLIGPGYQFGLADGIVTNFHQPGSTLLLLVAALVGDDWADLYAHALANDYRFLSYGDGSLLWR